MFGCLYVHQEPHGNNIGACRSLSPIQTRRGKNIAAEAQSPKTKSRRCCETMIFVLSLSEPISRGLQGSAIRGRVRALLAPGAFENGQHGEQASPS